MVSIILQSHVTGPSLRAPASSYRHFIPHPQVLNMIRVLESICGRGGHNEECRKNRNRKSEHNTRVVLFSLLLCLKLFTKKCFSVKMKGASQFLPYFLIPFLSHLLLVKYTLKKGRRKEKKTKEIRELF